MPDGGVASVRFFDTTLRDGEQAPGIALTAAEKLEVAEQLARLGVDVIEAGFPAQDAARTEAGFLMEVYRVAAEEGATTINVPDTVGYALPHEFGALVAEVVALVPPDVVVSTHCHNDLGLAVANTFAGVLAG